MPSSTRNCRIERLWVEVGSQFARCWRAFFMRLENLHHLDPGNPAHLWLLHLLFLADIDSDCQAFQAEWNCHPISGPDTNNKSPKDLRLLGQMRFGIYDEPSGEAEDEQSVDAITCQQREYINHATIHVPTHGKPFSSEAEVGFFMGLREVVAQDIIPDNFGLTPTEWPSDEYPLFEIIRVGRRKDVEISLADPIWYSRARLWCQALSVLSFYLASLEII
ncbi:hypothetical protein EDC04DRAFT_2593816 [Pisolithus marmoratus]|nr:hypothetical protein EDC04DRAFT_2593816 [Pisolithus marmoratus]